MLVVAAAAAVPLLLLCVAAAQQEKAYASGSAAPPYTSAPDSARASRRCDIPPSVQVYVDAFLNSDCDIASPAAMMALEALVNAYSVRVQVSAPTALPPEANDTASPAPPPTTTTTAPNVVDPPVRFRLTPLGFYRSSARGDVFYGSRSTDELNIAAFALCGQFVEKPESKSFLAFASCLYSTSGSWIDSASAGDTDGWSRARYRSAAWDLRLRGSICAQAHLPTSRLPTCLSAQASVDLVDDAYEAAERLYMTHAPSIYINGNVYCGPWTFEGLEEALCAAVDHSLATGVHVPVPSEFVSTPGRLWQAPLLVHGLGAEDWDCSADGPNLNRSSLYVKDALEREPPCDTAVFVPVAELLPAVALLFFTVGIVSFVCMLLTRRRIQMLAAQQRRRDSATFRLHEVLTILSAIATEGAAQQAAGRSHAAEAEAALAKMEQLEFLPSRAAAAAAGGEMQSQTQNQNTTCPICLDDLLPGDLYFPISCKHLMHAECLKTWVAKKNECPCCRMAVYKPQTHGARGAVTAPSSSSSLGGAVSTSSPAIVAGGPHMGLTSFDSTGNVSGTTSLTALRARMQELQANGGTDSFRFDMPNLFPHLFAEASLREEAAEVPEFVPGLEEGAEGAEGADAVRHDGQPAHDAGASDRARPFDSTSLALF